MTPLDYVWDACPAEATTFVRGQLGRVLFSGDDVDKPVGSLSGGEAARLIFCRIIVEKPNVLVLDEPTNHLDLEAIQRSSTALQAFEGTVLFVSHDRWFVSELATRILEVTADGPRDFPGTYAEYLERCGDDHLDADAVVLKAKTAKARSRPAEAPADSGVSWEEQKRRRNRLNALPAGATRCSPRSRRPRRGARPSPPPTPSRASSSARPRTRSSGSSAKTRDLGRKIEALLAEWEQIEKEIASLETQV